MTLPSNGPLPSLSIVVPTYNRRERLGRLLRSLEEHYRRGERFELVIADDGSTDGTAEMLARFAPPYPLRVLRHANAGPAAARNRALAVADGEVVLFLDDDVQPAEGVISRHLAVHATWDRTVVMGPMLPPSGKRLAPWLDWEARTLQKQYDAMCAGVYAPTPRQFYTANASVRRADALAVGGFNESFRRAEDVEFAYRMRDAGLRFVFLPDAAVWHEPDRSLEAWLRVPYEYGRCDVMMARDLGRAHVLEQAYREEPRRHQLSRRLAWTCVGHPRRLRSARWALQNVARWGMPVRVRPLQLFACSAAFNLQYWQGIADETGLGTRVWGGGAVASLPPRHDAVTEVGHG